MTGPLTDRPVFTALVSLIFALFLQSMGAVWWASSISARFDAMREVDARQDVTIANLTSFEEDMNRRVARNEEAIRALEQGDGCNNMKKLGQ